MRKWTAILLAVCLLLSRLAPAARAETAKYAAITFDDGPSIVTPALLDGLSERGVRATFFLCQYRILQRPEAVARVVRDGHEIGIHGCTHRHFTEMGHEELRCEIITPMLSIIECTGLAPRLVRPPGGLYNSDTAEICAEEGLSLILWSVDPQDWDVSHRANAPYFVSARTDDGDIVLMHDLAPDSIASALLAIDLLQERGYELCTVSELAEHNGTTLLPGNAYFSF